MAGLPGLLAMRVPDMAAPRSSVLRVVILGSSRVLIRDGHVRRGEASPGPESRAPADQ